MDNECDRNPIVNHVQTGRIGKGGLSSDPRTAVDILIPDMGVDGLGEGVDFMGEVVVFAVHLDSQVVYAPVHIAEAGSYIRIHFVEAHIHIVKTCNHVGI